jgi:hypothetical protein
MQTFPAKSIVAALVLFAGLGLSTTAKAGTVTVGNDPTHQGAVVDSCNNCGFVLPTPFSVANATVTEYTFFAAQAGDITPVLLSGVSAAGFTTFTVTGIGTDRTTTFGQNIFDFGLIAGSDVTGASTYFGFFDENSATVSYDYDGSGAGTFLVRTMPDLDGSFTDENTFQFTDAQGALNDRLYSIEATAVTPEPATFSLLALGLSSLGAMKRLSRR